MGTLVARKYASNLFFGLADHTYVECGTGAVAWGCWGGKTGGAEFRRGAGSTRRADAIAEPDERAGITCYLINGACHQAANRILYPAGITVWGANGYGISEALFGVYGRPRGILFFCRAPFHTHDLVVGDLTPCIDPGPPPNPGNENSQEGEDSDYLRRVIELYESSLFRSLTEDEEADYRQVQERAAAFQMESFTLMMDYRLGSDFARSSAAAGMLEHRARNEASRFEIEQAFADGDINVDDFVERINAEVLAFQSAAANTLDEKEYRQLFGLPRDDQVILGDPDIARKAYADFEQR